MIKSRGHARCTDGSRYPMPEITCKASTNDVAACSTARYDAHAEVPLTIKREAPDFMLVNLCDYKQSVTLIANSGVQCRLCATPQESVHLGRFVRKTANGPLLWLDFDLTNGRYTVPGRTGGST